MKLLNRVLLFLFIPLILWVFLYGHYTFLAFTELVILFATYELYNIFLSRGKKVYLVAGIIISFLIPLSAFFKVANFEFILIFSILILSILQIFRNSIHNATEKLSLTFFGIIYIPLIFSYIIKLKFLYNGGAIIATTFMLIWACDTMAYIFGVLAGRHKFSKISPNKSIEGIFGGFLGVLVVTLFSHKIIYYISYIFHKIPYIKGGIYNFYTLKLPIFHTVIFAALVTTFAVLGDLFESKIKREFTTKDSGKILLGHGGFLDRFDSALFVIPLVYFLCEVYFL